MTVVSGELSVDMSELRKTFKIRSRNRGIQPKQSGAPAMFRSSDVVHGETSTLFEDHPH